uniref:Uncharacterized protein n=1 Tax=Arundo donax TaxID=35708 RepID=A0A0A8YUE6_ARUDO
MMLSSHYSCKKPKTKHSLIC